MVYAFVKDSLYYFTFFFLIIMFNNQRFVNIILTPVKHYE